MSSTTTAFIGVLVGAAVTVLVAVVGELGRFGLARWERSGTRSDQKNDHRHRLLLDTLRTAGEYRKALLSYRLLAQPTPDDDLALDAARTDVDILVFRIDDPQLRDALLRWMADAEGFAQDDLIAADENRAWERAIDAVGVAVRACE